MTKEFEEKKKLIELSKEFEIEKHRLKMEELEMMRTNDIAHHEHEMERQRIKSAEIRKTQMRSGSGYKY